jgi:type IV pilus assembly protein PilE
MTGRARSNRGFTLIELMIVIAVVGTLGASQIPTLMQARKAVNEEAAIGSLRTLASAQQLFRDQDKNNNGVLDYAPTLKALSNFGLIPAQLGTGRDHGYAFYLETSPDGNHWSGVAAPAAIGRSGDRNFTNDETNVVVTGCPPGQHPDPATGKCEPIDTLFDDTAIGLIHALDTMSAGMALPAAKALAQIAPTLSQQLLTFTDTNHDGFVTFDEALRPDIFGATLSPLVQVFTDSARRDLALGIANEQLPAVQVTGFGGDLLAFLNRVPPFVPGGGLAR